MNKIAIATLTLICSFAAANASAGTPCSYKSVQTHKLESCAEWTTSQRMEFEAILHKHSGELDARRAQNHITQGKSMENAGKARQRTDPHGQQGKSMERNGQNMQNGGEQMLKDANHKISAAQSQLADALRKEKAEGSTSIQAKVSL